MQHPYGGEQVLVEELATHRHLHLVERVLQHEVRVQVVDPAPAESQGFMLQLFRFEALCSELVFTSRRARQHRTRKKRSFDFWEQQRVHSQQYGEYALAPTCSKNTRQPRHCYQLPAHLAPSGNKAG